MKNKKSIYILLPIVLLVWGFLIYQFFSMSNANPEIPKLSQGLSYKKITIKEQDTFTIDVNYRDPFLGKAYVKKETISNTENTNTVKINRDTLIWPSIQYRGIVSDQKDKITIFMLEINQQSYLMKKKDIEQQVVLKDGNRNAIQVIYKGKQRLINIQE